MKVTTLGCWGAYPYKEAGTTSYLVTGEDGFQLLMDVGSRSVNELEKEISPLDVDAVIISHYHPDHIADLGVLFHYRQLYPKTLWEPKILPVYGHNEDEKEFAKLSLSNVAQGHAYNVSGIESIGPFDISFIKTVHPVPCYAMRITEKSSNQTLVFTGDTGYFEGLATFAKDADLFLADVYFFEGNENHPAHLTSKEAGQIAKAASVKKLVLTHLPQFSNEGKHDDEYLENLRQESAHYTGEITVELAYPHKSWDLGEL